MGTMEAALTLALRSPHMYVLRKSTAAKTWLWEYSLVRCSISAEFIRLASRQTVHLLGN